VVGVEDVWVGSVVSVLVLVTAAKLEQIGRQIGRAGRDNNGDKVLTDNGQGSMSDKREKRELVSHPISIPKLSQNFWSTHRDPGALRSIAHAKASRL
jgi:hypothetical protein